MDLATLLGIVVCFALVIFGILFGNDVAAFETMLKKLEKIMASVNIVMTVSIAVDECPDAIKAYA